MKQAHLPHTKSCQICCQDTYVDILLPDCIAIPTMAFPPEDDAVLLQHPGGPAIFAGLPCEQTNTMEQTTLHLLL